MSEHICTPLDVSSVPCLDHTCHTHIGSSRPWVRHPILMHAHVRLSLILFDFSFYFYPHFLVFFLSFLSMYSDNFDSVTNNLRDSAKGSNDGYDVAFPLTGYEPKDTELNNNTELNDTVPSKFTDSQDPLFHVTPSSDQDMEDTTLGKLLAEVHRDYADYSRPEGVSVSPSSMSVMVDRTGKPVEKSNIDQFCFSVRNMYSAHNQFPAITQTKRMVDRTGKPVEEITEKAEGRESSSAQIGTLFDEQRRTIIAECCEKVSHHEFQAARAEQERQFYKKNYGVSKRIFVKFSNKILLRWRNYENSRVLPSIRSPDGSSSRIRTLLWNYQEDYKNCKMKYIVWTILRTSRTLNRYAVEILTLPVNRCYSLNILLLKGCWGLHSYRRDAKTGRQIFRIRLVYQETFLPIHKPPLQLLILKNWTLFGRKLLRNRFTCPQRRRVIDHNEIKIWDASLDRQPKIQSSSVEETIQRIMVQTNNDCRFRISILTSSLRQRHFACWKIRFKTGVCICSQFPTEAMQWIKEVVLVDSVDELRSSSSIRGIPMPNFEVLDARIASALKKSSIIHISKEESVWRNKRPRSRTVSFAADRLPT